MDLTRDSERKLDEVKSSVSKIDKLNDIRHFVSDSLLVSLGSPNLFVDNDVKNKLSTVVNSIDDCARDAYKKIENLIDVYEDPWTTNSKRKEIRRNIEEIQNIITGPVVSVFGTTSITKDALARSWQMINSFRGKYINYSNMLNRSEDFRYDNDEIECEYTLGNSWSDLSKDLNSEFVSAWAPRYYIIWDDWKAITASAWWEYKIKMHMADGSEKYVKIKWISIDSATHSLKISKNISFDPSDVDTNKPLEFNIAWSFDNVDGTWINIVHMKKVKIELNWNTLLDKAGRAEVFDNHKEIIGQALDQIFVDWNWKYNHKMEKQLLKDVLNSEKYNNLSEDQKEIFFQRLIDGSWAKRGKSKGKPSINDFYDGWNIREYDWFKSRFVSDDRSWNKEKENIKSKSNYDKYVNNHFEEESINFVNESLKSQMKNNKFSILDRLNEFVEETKDNDKDNDKDKEYNKRVTRRLDRKLWKKSQKMKKWPRSPFHTRDVNYMRFFNWTSKSIPNQVVKVNDGSWLNEIKYDLALNIEKNTINLGINIDGKNIKISAWEPSVLVRRVLRNTDLPTSRKARVCIWFDIYRAMIGIAKDKNISLSYRKWKKLREIYEKDWNVIIEEKKGEKRRKITFSKDNIHLPDRWIEKLWEHFNKYMNLYHKNYRKATERRILGLFQSPSRPTLPTCFWLSPIKKILNCGKKTTTNFDFDAPIKTKIWGKDIEVDFKKNKFTITIDKKKYSSRDLWKLLNLRSWNSRIFEWIDRELLWEIYRKLIKEMLRKNRKIARTSFGVKDSLTWKLYILDKNGSFWYISQEDLKKSGWHVMRWIISRLKKSWSLKDKNLFWNKKINYNLIADGSFEEKELLENPMLMQKFLKAMNRRMDIIF